MKTYLILHNIRSAYNVGSIFRTADACGISHIYLTGYTPTPIDNFGRVVKAISKTALGAEKSVAWSYFARIDQFVKKLKSEGVQLVAVEQADNSIDYKKVKITRATAFLFGNEVRGISRPLLQKCDVVAEIPMQGRKESLNVSVVVGIALFRVLNI